MKLRDFFIENGAVEMPLEVLADPKKLKGVVDKEGEIVILKILESVERGVPEGFESSEAQIVETNNGSDDLVIVYGDEHYRFFVREGKIKSYKTMVRHALKTKDPYKHRYIPDENGKCDSPHDGHNCLEFYPWNPDPLYMKKSDVQEFLEIDENWSVD